MRHFKQPLVLIVEDETWIALAVEQELDSQGFRACFAATEAEAAAGPISELVAAIVDLRLGTDLAGQRIIRNLRERMPGLPVVVMTGYDRGDPEADLRGLGSPTIRLHKPHHLLSIVPSIREVIERSIHISTQQHQQQRRRQTD